MIDPTLKFISTFGGAAAAEGKGIAIDSAGNSYIAGCCGSTGFPTTPGAFQPTLSGGGFVQKIDPSGNLVYSTMLAGSTGLSIAFGIAVEASGDSYVTGETSDADFPVLNAFQPTLAGANDVFVTEFNPTGSGLVYSSYLGGALNTFELNGPTGFGIAADAPGSAYVTGYTRSSDFPTLNAFQPVFGGGTCGTATTPYPCADAFVTKVAPGGSSLVYSTFLGGINEDFGYGVTVDVAGDTYVAGFTSSFDFPVLNAFQAACNPLPGSPTLCGNAFVTELDPAGSALVFSTYLGGSCGDNAQGVAVHSTGDVYVAGYTCSNDFPTKNAFQSSNASTATPPVNAFLTEFAPGGASLVYSTYLGGSGLDSAWAVGVDSLGEAFLTGQTSSLNFPVSNAIQATYGPAPTPGAAAYDAFVAGFQAGGKGLIYSTYLGGGGDSVTYGYGIAVDAGGHAWVTGASNSATFVAAIARPEVMHRYGPTAQSGGGAASRQSVTDRAAGGRSYARPQQTTSGVSAALAGSIALDMARVKAAPASLAFGAQVAGTTSAPETVTISNPGTAPLTFSAITASDNFAVASGGSCSTSSPVPAGGNCTVNVAFAPTAGGNLTGTLTLTDNGIGSPHSVPLSGTGQDFALSTNQNSASVTPGGTATFTLSIAPQSGFNQALNLSCSGAPSLSTCTVSPSSVTPNGTAASTATVSVTTTAPSQVAPRWPQPQAPRRRPWADVRARHGVPLLALALAMLGLAMLAAREWRAAWKGNVAQGSLFSLAAFPGRAAIGRGQENLAVPQPGTASKNRRAGKRALRYSLAFTLLLVLGWAACGGGGQPGTPPGTYTITLTAADPQASLSHSTTVTLTVNP